MITAVEQLRRCGSLWQGLRTNFFIEDNPCKEKRVLYYRRTSNE